MLLRERKELTYIENRAVSGIFRTIDPPPPSPPSECVLPPHQRRGIHTLAGLWGGGGSIFRKTPDIGLASYSITIIPLRPRACIKNVGLNIHTLNVTEKNDNLPIHYICSFVQTFCLSITLLTVITFFGMFKFSFVSGYQMEAPEGCPQQVYTIMKEVS